MPDRKRLLFVDDESDFLDAIRRMLYRQRQGWEIIFATSVDEALEEASRIAFDVIVSDVKMPGKDGFELLRSLHESDETKRVPVIMLTGAGDGQHKRHALELGATDLLNKPVKKEDLIARIRSVLRLKSYQDELRTYNDMLERKVAERTSALELSHRDIVWRLAKAGEYRDEMTGNHIARVGCYSRVLSEGMGMPRGFIETIFLTSPLHDIGKIGIPDEILLKPAKLTREERKTMEQHCAIGADILLQEPKGMRPFLAWQGHESDLTEVGADNTVLKMAASIAMTHHERWDGVGYPRGLSGNDIPLESRIVALSDVYDALCCARPYKPAYPEDKVLAIITEEAGGHFDPQVFACFENVIEDFRHIRGQFADEMCPAP